MTKKKEGCKRICANCTHQHTGAWFASLCNVVDKSKLNCITGQSEIVYLDPVNVNKNGDCPYYDENKQKVLWNEIKNLLEKYNREVFMKYHGDYTGWCEYFAMNELLRVLNGPRTWEDDSGEQTSEPEKKKKKHIWNLK